MWSINRPGVHMRMSILLVLPLSSKYIQDQLIESQTRRPKRTFSTPHPLRAEPARVKRSVDQWPFQSVYKSGQCSADRNAGRHLKTTTSSGRLEYLPHLGDKITSRQDNQGTQSGHNAGRQNLRPKLEGRAQPSGYFTSIIGRTYASVFPLPVGAETQTSRGG